jgi:cobalt-zinc-cadmium efflux system outer membrane protein
MYVTVLALAVGAGASAQASTQITLDQAIDLALKNNATIKAARTQIDQSKATQVTADLRPNPVLQGDAQFLPFFTPSDFNSDHLSQNSQFDIGAGYLFERGNKRSARLQAARDQTNVTSSQVADNERTLKFNVAQQFVNALLAKSNLDFALQNLKSFQDTVRINQDRFAAGAISKNDLLKIQVQLLQFQTDVSVARLAKAQALFSLRQLVGYQSVPRDFDVAGDLEFQPVTSSEDALESTAISQRPDLQAAKSAVQAAQSQIALAKANGKQDLNVSLLYSHVSGASSGSVFFTLPLPIFNRNQGEVARTGFALTQANLNAEAAEQIVLTDVRNSYEAVKDSEEIVNLYRSGYLNQAKESRDIMEFSYRQGAAPLLDFLDAERSYRATQLTYRQALATCMLAQEQLRQTVGIRNLP